MDSFFIEYRDPLFSIIILVCIIFIISFANYWWGIFKSKEEKSNIEKFIKRFEIVKDQDAFKDMLNLFETSLESLVILARSHIKSGDFETAIHIYLIALDQVKNITQKRYILSELGQAYFKAGFLKRSSEAFLESLKLSPRDTVSLKYLTVCYEMLKSYDHAIETLNALEELGVDVKTQKAYIKAKRIYEDTSIDTDERVEKLKSLKGEFKQVGRMVIEYKYSRGILSIKDFEDVDPAMVFDLVWATQGIDFGSLKEALYQSIAAAKGDKNAKEHSGIFELEVLERLHQIGYEKASLNFEFTCKECKHTFPIFFYRCPNCHALMSASIQPVLMSKSYEENIPFQ